MVINEETRHTLPMWSSGELLARLEARGVRKIDIARALGLDPSSVTAIFKGKRRIALDEGKKLVEHFGLDEEIPLPSEAVIRVVVRHMLEMFNLDPGEKDDRLAEVTSDFRAFMAFTVDPKRCDSVEQAEAFFKALSLRRQHRREKG